MSSESTVRRRLETLCVRQTAVRDTTFNSVTVPIYATSTFSFDGPGRHKGFDYTRTANPTRQALEECLAALEGGAGATATATGMAGEATIMALFPAGSHVIAGHDIYGGTYRLFASVLSTQGLDFSFVDMRNPDEIRSAVRPQTRAVWIETPSNPLLNLVDLQAVCRLAKERELTTIVDNTFMSPYFQQPLRFGADIVLHSTTKYLNGHSDVVGGAIISKTKETAQRIAALANALGTTCSPFDAWLVLRGLRTLACRMRVHEANALALARFLEAHPKVKRVYYPGLSSHPQHELAKRQMSGFGGMLSFDLQGGCEAAFSVVEKLHLFTFAESLGGVESLIEHPETMSHASMAPEARAAAGITGGTLRVSVGIEHVEDLIEDMRCALGTLA